MVIATFAWLCLGMLVFSKIFPLVPLFDMKEAMINREKIKIGRKEIPASIREWGVSVFTKRKSIIGLYTDENSVADAMDGLKSKGFGENESFGCIWSSNNRRVYWGCC